MNILRFFYITVLFFPVFDAAAQTLSEQEIKRMEDDSKIMESCISKIDFAEYKVLQQRINGVHSEIKALCQSGQRNKAMTVAVDFSSEIASDENIKIMRECSAKTGRPLPPLPYQEQELKNKLEHICKDMY